MLTRSSNPSITGFFQCKLMMHKTLKRYVERITLEGRENVPFDGCLAQRLLPEKLGGDVRPTSQNPYPINDPNRLFYYPIYDMTKIR